MSEITACPDCEASFIRRATRHSEHDWRCEKCGNRFDEPMRRKPVKNTSGFDKGTMAAKLDKANPDAIGGETSA